MPPAAPTLVPPTPMWQNPYVEVVRYALAHQNVGWQQHGDIDQVTDPHIHKNVFRIRGAIASANYVRFPREASQSNQGLGLTGRYVYIQLRRTKGQHATMHLDLLTTKKTVLRFSLSSMYPSLRSSGTVLRVPLKISEKWTTIVVDVIEMLRLHGFNGYSRETYRYLKAVTICASVNLRNVFTTSTCFTQENIPSSVALPSIAENQYGQCEWVLLPAALDVLKPLQTDSAKLQRRQHEGKPTREDDKQDVQCDSVAAVHAMMSVQAQNDAAFSSPEDSPTQPNLVDAIDMPQSPATRNISLIRDREDVLSRADQIMRAAGLTVPSPRRRSHGPKQSDERFASSLFSPRQYLKSEQSDWPDPILSLSRIIGFSTGFPKSLRWIPDAPACVYTSHSTIILREFTSESGGRLKYDVAPAIEAHDQKLASVSDRATVNSACGEILTDDREAFLVGHTGEICALEISRDGTLLASAQNTPQSVVRIWDFQNGRGECLVVTKLPAKTVHALAFAKDSTWFCCVTSDDHGRTQIFVYDCSSLLPSTVAGPRMLVLRARQTCDYHIHAIAFSQYESDQLISCGKESIRFWRVNHTRSHLSGSPVILKEYSRGTIFTDLAFDAMYSQFPSNLPRLRPLFVSSSVGTMLVINYDTRDVICVYKLHDAAIHSICINEGFCVTGSEDKFLRVWPLDFSDFFLEAEHEAPVKSVDVSSDGMRVTVGTSTGAIGILHLADKRYRTVLRSHSRSIHALAALPGGSLATSASDGTMRVWDVVTGTQTMEFDVSRDVVTCLSPMPMFNQSPVTIAVGFQSGSSRIFSLGDEHTNNKNASSIQPHVLFEFQQHQSPLCDIQYQSNAKTLYTSAAGQQICMHDVTQGYAPIKMLIADMDVTIGKLCMSRDGRFLAVIHQGKKSVLLLDAVSLCVVKMLKPPGPRHPNSMDRMGDGVELVHIAISWNSQELIAISCADRAYVFSLSENHTTAVAFGAVLQSMPLLGQQGISSVALSPNLKYIATGGSDGSVRVWQCEFGKHKFQRMHQTFLLHAGDGLVRRLSFSDDGTYIIAVSDSTQAVFMWKFRGDTSKLPDPHPEADLGSVAAYPDGAVEQSSGLDNRANFELPLDDFSHKTKSERSQDDGWTGVGEVAPQVMESVTLKMSLRTLNIDWKRVVPALSETMPTCFAWSPVLGCVIYSVGDGRIVVVEKVESGEQYFTNLSDIAEHIVLSPTHDAVAIVPASKKAVLIGNLRGLRRDNQVDDGEEVEFLLKTSEFELSEQLCSLQAIEFSIDSSLLCLSGENHEGSRVIVLDVTGKSSATWHVILSEPSIVTCVLSQSSREFLCVVPNGSAPLLRLRVPPFELSTVALPLEPVLDIALPSNPHLFCFRDDNLSLQNRTERCRFAVAVDSTSYAYFFDLDEERLMHVMQLILPTLRTSILSIQWIGTNNWQALIASLSTGEIAVFDLPTRSCFTSLRTRVAAIDWNQLKRTARLSCSNVLMLREERILRVITDPWSEIGVVIAINGTAFVVNFRSQHRQMLHSSPTLGSTTRTGTSCTTLGLDGSLLLTMTGDRRAIQCWEPRIGREIARLQLPSTLCSCFSVSVFDSNIVVAGYDDSSLRIYDLHDQRLVLQCSLPNLQRSRPSPGGMKGTPTAQFLSDLKQKELMSKSSVCRKGSPSKDTIVRGFQELRFIGPSCILAVTKSFQSGRTTSPSRFILLDVSDFLGSGYQAPHETDTTKNHRHNPKRCESVVHYRYIFIPSPAQIGGFRSSPGTGTSLDWDVAFEGVDVQSLHTTSTPNNRDLKLPGATNAFVVVVRLTSRRSESVSIVGALVYFGNDTAADHLVHKEDEILPCDSWLLDSSVSPSVMFHPSESTQLIYFIQGQSKRQLEVRDFQARTPIYRIEIPGETVPASFGTLARWQVRGKEYLAVTSARDDPPVLVDLATRTVYRVRNLLGIGAVEYISTRDCPFVLVVPGRGLVLAEPTFSNPAPRGE